MSIACKAQFKDSPQMRHMLHRQSGVQARLSFRANVRVEDVNLSSVGRLFHITAVDTAKTPVS